MDLVKHDNKERRKIIKELVHNKQKLLKLKESSDNSESESEDHRKIVTLVKKERNNIFDKDNIKLEEINLEKQSILSQKITFPVIPKHKIDRMLSLLKSKKKVSNQEKKLIGCLLHIHSCAKPPWNSPSVILKAIKDCILRRKWENLARLTLMLIHFPYPRYKMMIRHICQILDKYHPVIRNKGLQNQFNMITATNKISQPRNTTLVSDS